MNFVDFTNIEFSLANEAFCFILAGLGHINTATSFAFFTIANKRNSKSIFSVGVTLFVIGMIVSQISMASISVTTFSVLRIVKIPTTYTILYISGDIESSCMQTLLLMLIVGITIITVIHSEVKPHEIGNRQWMNIVENSQSTQIFLLTTFIFGMFGISYTLCAARPEPLRAFSLYNLAFPLSCIMGHGSSDVFAKIIMEEIVARYVPVWVWAVIAISCVVMTIFMVWYINYMYTNLHVESIIPLHTVGLVLAPVLGGYFILGETLKTPFEFYICLGLITINLMIFFAVAPAHHMATDPMVIPNVVKTLSKDNLNVDAAVEDQHEIQIQDPDEIETI